MDGEEEARTRNGMAGDELDEAAQEGRSATLP